MLSESLRKRFVPKELFLNMIFWMPTLTRGQIELLPEDSQKFADSTKIFDDKFFTKKPKLKRSINHLHNPIIGPFQADGLLSTSTILKRENYDFSKDRIFSPLKREMHAQGQPACGILGDRAYIGSGLIWNINEFINESAKKFLKYLL